MEQSKRRGWSVINLVSQNIVKITKTKKKALEECDKLNKMSEQINSKTRYAVLPGDFEEGLFV